MTNKIKIEAHPDHDKYIDGIRKKDRKVIHTIYDEYLNGNVVWVQKNKGTREDGFDIFQDALEVIIRKAFLTNYILPCDFGAYLHGVCRLLWLKELKKRGRRQEVIHSIKAQNHSNNSTIEKLIQETIDGDRWFALLERSLLQLTQLCQKLLKLYRQGTAVDKIASLLDMKENAVYRRRYVCTGNWRKAMEQDPDFKNSNPFGL